MIQKFRGRKFWQIIFGDLQEICQHFLNQARASLQLALAWFLKIDPVRIIGMRVCVCVCVSALEAINN